ncbi:hypothetical protein AC249_AIPGENE10387 [Exaiptasia diaphana]|nr:hypothetical protein AC249_AIPGENE10387 [Exaiptasia diaphana]
MLTPRSCDTMSSTVKILMHAKQENALPKKIVFCGYHTSKTDIIQSISSKTCNLDPIPTSGLKHATPTITTTTTTTTTTTATTTNKQINKKNLQQLVPAIAPILRTSLKDGKSTDIQKPFHQS